MQLCRTHLIPGSRGIRGRILIPGYGFHFVAWPLACSSLVQNPDTLQSCDSPFMIWVYHSKLDWLAGLLSADSQTASLHVCSAPALAHWMAPISALASCRPPCCYTGARSAISRFAWTKRL